MTKPLNNEHLQRRLGMALNLPIKLREAAPSASLVQPAATVALAVVAGLPVRNPLPPRVEPCPACLGEGYGCVEECRGTGRVVTGGTLPTLDAASDELRAWAAEEMAMEPRHRVLTSEQLDRLCVLAQAMEGYAGRLSALRDENEQLRAAKEG